MNKTTPNQLLSFQNPNWGTVRTTQDGNTVLFCGLDIAKALGYKNPSKALKDHCKHAVERCANDSLGRSQNMTFVSEGDVYRLIARSRLKHAQEFERWIFDTVIPSIRENGGYIANQEALNDEEVLANAVLVAKNIIDRKNREIAILEPKAAYFESVVEEPESITTTTLASIYGWSVQRLNVFLALCGVQYKKNERWWITDKYADRGYVRRKAKKDGVPTPRSGQMYWTKAGREFVGSLLAEEGVFPLADKISKSK